MPARRILVILNPVSGQGKYDAIKPAIEKRLRDAGVDYVLRETGGEGDAMCWAKEAAGYDLVLVGGGDGTVMEAMSGCVKADHGIPLAQLPLGTANLLLRALGIPAKLEEALSLALGEGVVVSMDVGFLPDHDRYFALVAGSGWDAQLIADADRELKNRLGFFAYVLTGVKNLFHLRNSRIRLVIDGRELRFRAHTVEVINIGEIYGTGIKIGENLSPHDGRLDLAVLATHRLGGIFKLLWRILTGRFGDGSSLRYFTGQEIAVEAIPPLKLQIDGEAVGETPYRATVVPGGAILVVPREYAEAKALNHAAV